MDQEYNAHNKKEFPPAHTTEHILNQTMIRMFNCGRSIEAHIEEKKSKMDFKLSNEPSSEQMIAVENKVNEIIGKQLAVTMEFTTQTEAKDKYNLTRLPEDASEAIRIVHIGDYDACPCIGAHVNNTNEIGKFSISSYDFNNGVLRIRWKVTK